MQPADVTEKKWCWVEIIPRENQDLRPSNLILFIQHLYNRGEPFKLVLMNDVIQKMSGPAPVVRYMLCVSTPEDAKHIATISKGWGFHTAIVPPPAIKGQYEGIIDIEDSPKPAPYFLSVQKGQPTGIEVRVGEVAVRSAPALDAWSSSEHLHELVASSPNSAVVISAQRSAEAVKILQNWAETGVDSFFVGVIKEMGRMVRGIFEETLRGNDLFGRGGEPSRDYADLERQKQAKIAEERRLRAQMIESRVKDFLLLCEIRTYGPPGFAERVSEALPAAEAKPRCFSEKLRQEPLVIEKPEKLSMRSIRRAVCRLFLYLSIALIAISVLYFITESILGIRPYADFINAIILLAGILCLVARVRLRTPNPVIMSTDELAAIGSIPVGFRLLSTVNIFPAKPKEGEGGIAMTEEGAFRHGKQTA